MTVERCSFRTDRLLVQPWHDPPADEWPTLDLPTTVADMMTEAVTRFLPGGWQGPYSVDRARQWIAERDLESPTLLAIDRSTGDPVGLVILFESPADTNGLVEVRLGYLLAETAWGKGLATELLSGLVAWSRDRRDIGSIVGGVAAANSASSAALERLGFSLIESGAHGSADELLYELPIRY